MACLSEFWLFIVSHKLRRKNGEAPSSSSKTTGWAMMMMMILYKNQDLVACDWTHKKTNWQTATQVIAGRLMKIEFCRYKPMKRRSLPPPNTHSARHNYQACAVRCDPVALRHIFQCTFKTFTYEASRMRHTAKLCFRSKGLMLRP